MGTRPFGRSVRHYPMAKHRLSRWLSRHHDTLFYMGWHVQCFRQLHVANDLFFFFFSSFVSPFLKFAFVIQNFRVVISFTDILTLVLIFFFVLGSFVKSQFHHWIYNCDLLFFFSNLILIFLLWYFVLDSFVNLILIFNFPLQFKFLTCYLIYFFISYLVLILINAIFLFSILLYNWFFVSILSFNIWMIEN